jgi:hypothetical protein
MHHKEGSGKPGGIEIKWDTSPAGVSMPMMNIYWEIT